MSPDPFSTKAQEIHSTLAEISAYLRDVLPGCRETLEGSLQRLDGLVNELLDQSDAATEREQLVLDNRRQRALLEKIIAGAPVGIAVMSGPEHRFTLTNPVIDQISRGKGTYLGKTAREVWPEVAEQFIPVLDHIYQTGEPYQVQDLLMPVVRGQGPEEAYMTYSYTPLYNDAGQVDSILALLNETTEQVKIRHQLDEERARLKAIFENAPEGIIFANPQGQILLANSAAQRLYARPVPIGHDYAEHAQLELCDEQGQPISPRQLPLTRSALDGETRTNCEMTVHWPDGQLRPLLVNTAPVYNGQGTQIGAVGMFQDISQIKQSEEALRLRGRELLESNARFRSVWQSASDAMALSDAQGCVLAVNPAYCELYGYAEGQLVGQDFAMIYPPETRAWAREQYQVVFNAPEVPGVYEATIQRGDGEQRVVESRIGFLIGQGQRTAMLSVIRDITQRKQAEQALKASQEALRLSEERFRLAARAVPGAIYDWNMLTDEIYRSEGMLNLVGISAEDLAHLGQAWIDRVHPEDRPRMQAQIDAFAHHQETTFEAEYRVQHMDGHWVHIWDRSIIIRDETGRPIRLIGSSTDISARKQSEIALRESEQRERERAAEIEAILDAVPAYVWISRDPQSRYINGNQAAYELLRRQRGENLSKSAPEDELPRNFEAIRDGQVIPPEQLPVQHAAATGQPVRDYEFSLCFEDGTQVDLIGSATPLLDDHGHSRGAVSAFMDITERKHIEEELRRSKQHIEDILTSIQDTFFELDRDWRFTFANQHAIQTAQAIGSPLIGSVIWESMPFIAGTPYEAIYRRVMQTRQAEHQELHSLVHDLWFDLGVYPSINGITVYAQDITDRKQAEAALRENQEVLNLALATAPITIAATDQERHYKWIFNPPGEKLPADLLGKRDEEARPPEDVAELVAAKEQVLLTGEKVQREIKVRVQGQSHYYLINFEPTFDADGAVSGLIGIAMDITEMHDLEAERQEIRTQVEVQRRLMENREKERQQIARDIHDGPIQTLVGTIFNIQLTKEAVENAALKLELDQVTINLREAVQELRSVVNDLRPPALLRFGLVKTLNLYLEDLGDKHPQLHFELVMPNALPPLPEDATLSLFRICQEALNNIIRHARASRVEVRCRCEADRLWLEIQDNGRGFPVSEELIDQVQSGHFGLAGMRERAEAVGGALSITSVPGQGTLVQVTLPRKG